MPLGLLAGKSLARKPGEGGWKDGLSRCFLAYHSVAPAMELSLTVRSSPVQHVVVVSPHQDDAALSLSAILAALAARGVRLTIVTCHTRSRWAPAVIGRRTIGAVSRLRAAEDRAYARGLGARLVELDFSEAALRLPDRPVSGRTDAAHIRALGAALEPHLRGADATFIPLGLPGHLDHRATRAAALLTCDRQGVAFHEDIPYALWGGPKRMVKTVETVQRLLGRRLHPLQLARDAPEVRQRAVAGYPSQFTADERRLILDGVARRGGDRLWATSGLRNRLRACLQCR